MLTVDGVTVRYGDSTAVDDLSLTVADREVLCVLGPSGSGKSTLLRAIAGLQPLAAGSVRWDGHDLAPVPAHKRGFGLMFQDHALFQHRDVGGNVAFGLRMQRTPAMQTRARVDELLELVGLPGTQARRVSELSGGEQQRVALARALAPSPRLLMLDEPLGSLDRALRDQLAPELRALFLRVGLTAVFVTHDHDEAFAIADRIAVMRDGRIEQIDTPEALWRKPRTEFVARFLGYNVTDVFGGTTVAVRPDRLSLTDDGAVAGRVVTRTFRRDHFLVEIAVEGGPLLEVVVRGDDVPGPGDPVRVDVDAGALVTLEA
jgi:thiamine transport system ATP-binding protein